MNRLLLPISADGSEFTAYPHSGPNRAVCNVVKTSTAAILSLQKAFSRIRASTICNIRNTQQNKASIVRVSLAVVVCILLSAKVDAATITAQASGSWQTGSTWAGGTVPLANDDVIIPAGITVTYNANNFNTPHSYIKVAGTLELGNGQHYLQFTESAGFLVEGGILRLSASDHDFFYGYGEPMLGVKTGKTLKVFLQSGGQFKYTLGLAVFSDDPLAWTIERALSLVDKSFIINGLNYNGSNEGVSFVESGVTAPTTSASSSPTITSTTYDANTGVLSVTGTNFVAKTGVTNDVAVTKLTITGEGGSTYTLTTSDVEITSATAFSVTLNATDKAAVNLILNKNGAASTGTTTYNLAGAADWMANVSGATDATNGITVSNVAVPAVTSSTYNANTGTLAVTGTGFLSASGATNDIVANKFTLTGEGGATYTLTDTANPEITSGTSFTITLSATDKSAINQIINKNGTSSTGGTTYNLAAAEDWAAGANASVNVVDASGNGVTASNVAVPAITSATYNANTGTLAVTGTGFLSASGATNDIVANKFTLTGEGGATYTLTDSANPEITSGTLFTITLSATDKSAINQIINKNGTSSTGGTTYNLSAAEDWAAGTDAAVVVADATGNGITVSNVAVPAITSATYNANTGTLSVTGTGFLSASGATNDIVANKFTLTGEGGSTYTLTDSANPEITSGTSFTITLSATDKSAINQIINKNGSSSTGGTTYNLSAAEDWAAGANASVNVVDASGNGVTASNVAVPAITSATYNANTGTLSVTGTGFLSASGATNDIVANKFTLTGEGGATYTLTDSANPEITSGTSFTITLSSTDKSAVNTILNKNGTSSIDATTYILAAAEDWAAGADPAVVTADLTGNGLTVSNVNIAPVAALGTAINFERSRSEGLQVADHSSLALGTGSFTIETWLKRSSGTGFFTILGKQTGAGTGVFLRFNDNVISFAAGTYPSSTDVTSVSSISDNNWHHVAAVMDATGKSMKIYIDGVLDASSSFGTNYTISSSANMGIGFKPNFGEYFDGSMDEVRIWSTARTAAQIKEYMYTPLAGTETGLVGYWNFEEGSGTSVVDRSANSNTGTLINADGDEFVSSNTSYSVSLNENSNISARLGGSDVNDQTTATAVITVLPSKGKLYQTNDGTTKGTEITATSTSLTDNGGNPRRLIYEPTAGYIGTDSFTYNVNDGSLSSSNTQTVSLTINNVNENPTDITLSASSINENVAGNSTVGTLSSTDPDAANTFTYTLVSGTGDTDNASFNISGNSLRITNSPNYESKSSYTVRIRSTDQGSLTYEEAFTITVNDLDDVGPAITSVSVPANGTYTTGQNLDFTINLNESTVVNTAGGTPQLGLTIGSTSKSASYLSGSGSSALVFRYTVASSDADANGITIGTLSANGGSLKDGTGNDAALTLNSVGSTAAVLVDALAPTVTSVNVPTNGIYKSGDQTNFTVNFSENVTVTGTPNLSLTIGSSTVNAAYTLGSGGSSIVFRYTVASGDADNDGVSVGTLALNSGTIKDAVGNDATLTLNSIAATGSILVDAVAPTISGITSSTANGSYKAGDGISIQANFSEAVTVTGTPQLTLETGTTDRVVNYAGGSGTSTLTFTYTVQAGDVSSDLDYVSTSALALNSGTIKDAAGNNATLTLAAPAAANSLGANKALVIDGIAPAVSSINRANATPTNSSSVDFTLSFSESVTGVDASDFTLTSTGSASGTVASLSGSGNSYTVTVNTISGDGTLRLDLSSSGTGVTDAVGNAISGGYTSGQSYTIDKTAPIVINVGGPANGTYKAGDNLNLTVNFSEAVSASGTPYLPFTIGSSSVNASIISVGGNVVTFRYQVTSGDLDTDGIALATAINLNGGSLSDAAGNTINLNLANVSSTAGVLVDAVAPTLTSVTIASNNPTSTLAKAGNLVTVTFTASEAISTPSATIAGQTATVVHTSGNTYTAKYTMTSSSTEGTIPFNISFADLADNSGTAVTATTDMSLVTFDKTAPATPSGLAASSGDTQIVLNWTANAEGDLKSYKVYGGTSANPATLLNTANASATSYTHTGLINGTTYYYRIAAVDNAGNESTASADVTSVPKAPQTITFALTAKTYGDADFDPAATASSGLGVSYASDNTAVATIVAGKIHIVGAGTATITASQAGNAAYLSASDRTQTLTVNKKDITVSLNPVPLITKVYDGNTSATLVSANYSLNGVEAADVNDVTIAGTAAYADKNVTSEINVTSSSLVLSGTKKDNYNLTTTSASTTGTITKKDITVSLNATPLITKVYDGGTAATLVTGNYSLAGLVAGDVVATSGNASYTNKNVANGIIVNADNFVLTGAQKDNYNLTTTSASTTGDITKKDITLVLSATPLISKVYNGNALATLASGNYILSGIESGDLVTVSGSASYADKSAGTSKAIIASAFVLTGAQKDNYNLSTTSATTTGDITKKDITVSITSTPLITKIYDGGTAATLDPANYSLAGLETGDVVSVSGNAFYVDKNVGSGIEVNVGSFTLAGAQKDNYNLTTASATTTGEVIKQPLTVTAENKSRFQGQVNPAFSVSYNGFVNGESKAVLSTAPTATTTATTASAIGSYDIVPSGGVSANYSFTYVNGTLTVLPGHPTSVSLTAQVLFENAAAGAVAGTLSSTSDDPNATFTYTLVNGAGDTDNGSFAITGNQLATTAPLNFEQKPSYKVRVRSTTQHGLSLDKELTIELSDVNEQPTLADIGNQVICYTTSEQVISIGGISAGPDANQETTLTVSSTNNALFESLEVTPANGSGNAAVKYKITDGAFGSAVINVMVMDNGGTAHNGINTILKSFILQVNQLPSVGISSDKGLELSKGELAVLKANVTGGNNSLIYSWSNAAGILSGQNTQNLTVRPSESTTYKVTVTNANGCSVTQEIAIGVNADYKVVNGTNIISPNGDGVNDNLVIRNLDMYPKNEVKIFDRAGRLIYSQKNYTDQWDGTLNGSQLAEDTYYYVVDFGPGIEKIKGFISIVRD